MIDDYYSISLVSPPLGKSTLANDVIDVEDEIIELYRSRPGYNPFNAVLPGQGVMGEGCGEPRPMFCNTCGHAFWDHSSCRQRDCPACYEKWAFILARRAAMRFWQFKMDMRSKGIEFRLLHCVISFRYVGQSVKLLSKECVRIMKEKGISGGYKILHPFRQDDDNKWIMDGTVHFHVVGIAFGNVQPGSKEEYDRIGGGYFFKILRDAECKDYKGVRSKSGLIRLIQYQLSHCGIIEDKHSASWFGCVSYNKFKMNKEEIDDEHSYGCNCPKCGSKDTEPCYQFVKRDSSGSYFGQMDVVHPCPDFGPPGRRIVKIVWRDDDGL